MPSVRPPEHDDDWIAICGGPLAAGDAIDWATVDRCGGVVTFTGTVRDHARSADGERRDGVTVLEYEAYEGPAVQRMTEIAGEARRRWPDLGRLALLHRVGRLALRDVAVIVAVSAPHRGEAFEAARWVIDTLKDAVPIWKKEEWSGGSDWGGDARPLADVTDRSR